MSVYSYEVIPTANYSLPNQKYGIQLHPNPKHLIISAEEPSPASFNPIFSQVKPLIQSKSVPKGIKPSFVIPSKTPGTGHYQKEKEYLIKNTLTFNKKKKVENYTHWSQLGPDHYKTNLQHIQKTIFSKTFGFKFDERIYDNYPGVGQYNSSLIQKSENAHQFPKQERFLDTAFHTPGVGSYNFEQLKTSIDMAFGHGQRDFETEFVNPTGPGEYFQQKPPIASKGITMGAKFKKKELEQYPGVGTYNPKKKDTTIKYKIRTSKRQELINSVNQVVGPGSYDQNYLNKNPIEIQFPIQWQGKDFDHFLEEQQNLPGPADYHIFNKSNFQFKKEIHVIFQKQYSIGKQDRFDKPLHFINPGPGNYQIIKYPQNNIGTFSVTEKHKKPSFITPSPNQYHIAKAYGIKEPNVCMKTFSKSTTKPFYNHSLGPGQYNISGDILKIPSYMKKRMDKRQIFIQEIQNAKLQQKQQKEQNKLKSKNEQQIIPEILPIRLQSSEQQDLEIQEIEELKKLN